MFRVDSLLFMKSVIMCELVDEIRAVLGMLFRLCQFLLRAIPLKIDFPRIKTLIFCMGVSKMQKNCIRCLKISFFV